MENFITDFDLDRGLRLAVLEHSWHLKHGDRNAPFPADIRPVRKMSELRRLERDRGVMRGLTDRNVALVMAKPSLRTRVSFTAAIRSLGGEVIEVGPHNTKLGCGEDIEEWAGVLGRMVDGIVARVHEHSLLESMAAHAGVPVINALCNDFHPCQAVADAFTVWENARFRGRAGADSAEAYYAGDRRWAWLGDVSNVANSLMISCAQLGVTLSLSAPAGRGPDPKLLASLRAMHPRGDQGIVVHEEPREAVRGAEAVFTDTWVSMGQEGRADADQLEAEFGRYRVDEHLMGLAADDAIFMHCLPAQPDHEVERSVLRGRQSRALEGAENRMWTTRAVLDQLFPSRNN